MRHVNHVGHFGPKLESFFSKRPQGQGGPSVQHRTPNESFPTVQPLFDMLKGMATDSVDNFESADLYVRLGVSRSASLEEIKKAFRALARDHHPDHAGSDPKSAKRFVQIREAYEVLSDPSRRQRYDGRGTARPGLNAFRPTRDGVMDNQDHRGSYADDLDLEDIFSDRLKGGMFRGTAASTPRDADFGFGDRGGTSPEHGADVVLVVEISPSLAERGGSQTLEYVRWVPSDDGLALRQEREIFDLRLGPDNEHGDSIRIPKMGNAGRHGGGTGDLVCDLVVLPTAPELQPESEERGQAIDDVVYLTIQQALLGGTVRVRCPGGVVNVTIAPCSSSGQRLRIAGKGHYKTSGSRDDHEFRLEIVSPQSLDPKSRALIEEFAARNSYNPQEGHES
jgi:curved DNA-binding protein